MNKRRRFKAKARRALLTRQLIVMPHMPRQQKVTVIFGVGRFTGVGAFSTQASQVLPVNATLQKLSFHRDAFNLVWPAKVENVNGTKA